MARDDGRSCVVGVGVISGVGDFGSDEGEIVCFCVGTVSGFDLAEQR